MCVFCLCGKVILPRDLFLDPILNSSFSCPFLSSMHCGPSSLSPSLHVALISTRGSDQHYLLLRATTRRRGPIIPAPRSRDDIDNPSALPSDDLVLRTNNACAGCKKGQYTVSKTVVGAPNLATSLTISSHLAPSHVMTSLPPKPFSLRLTPTNSHAKSLTS